MTEGIKPKIKYSAIIKIQNTRDWFAWYRAKGSLRQNINGKKNRIYERAATNSMTGRLLFTYALVMSTSLLISSDFCSLSFCVDSSLTVWGWLVIWVEVSNKTSLFEILRPRLCGSFSEWLSILSTVSGFNYTNITKAIVT